MSPTNVGQRRKFRSALPRAVNYFTDDNEIRNHWEGVDVHFKDDAMMESIRWAARKFPQSLSGWFDQAVPPPVRRKTPTWETNT